MLTKYKFCRSVAQLISCHSANQYVLLPFILIASAGISDPERWGLTFNGNTYCMYVSQSQYSFHQYVPTEIRL